MRKLCEGLVPRLVCTWNRNIIFTHTYHIAGNFQGRKLPRIGEKYDFRGENFRRLLACAVLKDATPPNFSDKTFANCHKTAKFMKVFSLESFPLYSTYTQLHFQALRDCLQYPTNKHEVLRPDNGATCIGTMQCTLPSLCLSGYPL